MKAYRKLTALTLAVLTLCGCGNVPAAPSEPAGAATLAEAQYPAMSPYPNETDFIDPVTGEFDDEGFFQVYEAWQQDHAAQTNVPEGYAEGLGSYFRLSIPELLAGGSENSVCSPLNVYMALAMLAQTTDGTSRQEILTLLGADSLDALRDQAGAVWNAHYCDDGASTCVLANSLWLDSGLTYNPETARVLAEDYYASAFQGDLGSDEMNKMLQKWLNDQTSGLLKEQAQNLELDPQTVLALASTIYYRAKWSDEFWPENNTEGIFHAPGGDTEHTFLNRELSYGPYYWGADFGAVSLGLEDGSRMWLILPDEGLTPADLLASGNALELVLGDIGSYENQKRLRVNLRLPKFDVSASSQLGEGLKHLGILSVFDPESADFTPILPESAAWLDSVSHAARVRVDEEGVEAAAYTVMAVCGAAMPPEEEMDFILDRPFLFVISSADNLPLFAGVVNHP